MSDEHRDLATAIARLERDMNEVFDRLRLVDRLDERMLALNQSVTAGFTDCRTAIESVAEDLEADRDRRDNLQRSDKAALYPLYGAIAAAVIGAVALLLGSGAIHL